MNEDLSSGLPPDIAEQFADMQMNRLRKEATALRRLLLATIIEYGGSIDIEKASFDKCENVKRLRTKVEKDDKGQVAVWRYWVDMK